MTKPTLSQALFLIRTGLLIGLSITGMLVVFAKSDVEKQAESVPNVIWPIDPSAFQDKQIMNMARAVQENTTRVSTLMSQTAGQDAAAKLLKNPWIFWLLLVTPLITALLTGAERIAANAERKQNANKTLHPTAGNAPV